MDDETPAQIPAQTDVVTDNTQTGTLQPETNVGKLDQQNAPSDEAKMTPRVGMAAVRPAEFIILQFTQDVGQG
ncbi:hypothetical protein BGZ83_001209 [Gryganskiella cystojenkinii]|nr:hypothetical protein BGZ83_001209 [Gryganskiella cystojenkinii]